MGKKGRWGTKKDATTSEADPTGASHDAGLDLLAKQGSSAAASTSATSPDGNKNAALAHLESGILRGQKDASSTFRQKRSEFDQFNTTVGTVSNSAQSTLEENLKRFLALVSDQDEHCFCLPEGFCARTDLSTFEQLFQEFEFLPTWSANGFRLRRDVIDVGMFNYRVDGSSSDTTSGVVVAASRGNNGPPTKKRFRPYNVAESEQVPDGAFVSSEPRRPGGGSGTPNCIRNAVWENCPTYRKLIQFLVKKFEIQGPVRSVINFYQGNNNRLGFHKDSYYGNVNFTVGVSLGATRNLEFITNEEYQRQQAQGGGGNMQGGLFSFPQGNGDIFAFSEYVNNHYRHGVPNDAQKQFGGRISVVVWGHRETKFAKVGAESSRKRVQPRDGMSTRSSSNRDEVVAPSKSYYPYEGDFVVDFAGEEGERIVYDDAALLVDGTSNRDLVSKGRIR
ncbi:unnamed protein product [Amoebophrya sp. A120]|nr:unnamed protein product [Amoebophrya sp. A120]|eukprot:GSA120T00022834001.1